MDQSRFQTSNSLCQSEKKAVEATKNIQEEHFFSFLKERDQEDPDQENPKISKTTKYLKVHLFKFNRIFRFITISPSLLLSVKNLKTEKEDLLHLSHSSEEESKQGKILKNKAKFADFSKSSCIVVDKFNTVYIIPYISKCVEIMFEFHDKISTILASLNDDSLFIGTVSGEVIRVDFDSKSGKNVTQHILISPSDTNDASRVNDLKFCDNERFLVASFNSNLIHAVHLDSSEVFKIHENLVVICMQPVGDCFCIITQFYLITVLRLTLDGPKKVFTAILNDLDSFPQLTTFKSQNDSFLILTTEKKLFIYLFQVEDGIFIEEINRSQVLNPKETVKLVHPVSKIHIHKVEAIITLNTKGQLLLLRKNSTRPKEKYSCLKLAPEDPTIEDFYVDESSLIAVSSEKRIISHNILNV